MDLQRGVDRLDRDEGHDAEDACDEKGQRVGIVQQAGYAPEHEQQQSDFHGLYRRYGCQLALHDADPVHFLVGIEKELEPHHGEEGPAKPCNADMGR